MHSFSNKWYVFGIIIVCCSTQVLSQTSKKSNYHLLNPTPKIKMRGFETDRPDMTESAYTVDAGHFQLETDLAKISFERHSKDFTHAYNIPNLKVGLTNSTDLQLVFTSYSITKPEGSDLTHKRVLSDFTIRLKQNLIGNDSGRFDLGVISFVNFPGQNNSKYSGGVIIPMALQMGKWCLGWQVEGDFIAHKNMPFTLLTTSTISYSLLDRLSIFVEQMSARDLKKQTWQNYINGGFVLDIAPNVKMDLATNLGLQNTTSTSFFVGLSVRH